MRMDRKVIFICVRISNLYQNSLGKIIYYKVINVLNIITILLMYFPQRDCSSSEQHMQDIFSPNGIFNAELSRAMREPSLLLRTWRRKDVEWPRIQKVAKQHYQDWTWTGLPKKTDGLEYQRKTFFQECYTYNKSVPTRDGRRE